MSASALRIAEVDGYHAKVECTGKTEIANKKYVCQLLCNQKGGTVEGSPASKTLAQCVGLIGTGNVIAVSHAGDQDSAATCTAYKGHPKGPCGKQTKGIRFYATYDGIFGDPHVVNMAGEKFDILATGAFSLLSLTRATEEDLLINGTIARFGAKCGESFITDLEHTGGWIRKAYNTEALKVRAVQDTPKTEALQVNFGQKWQPLSNLQEMAHLGKAAGAMQLDFSSVTVKVSAGKHWRHGWNFLNLDVQGLASLDDNIRVGGLLGYDDHTHVLQADADCAMFAEAAGTDMQNQQSCLSYLKAN